MDGGVAIPEFLPRKYNEVVKSAILEDIRLMSSFFEIKEEYFKFGEEEQKKSGVFDLSHSSELKFVHYNAEGGQLLGLFEWVAAGETDGCTILEIKASYTILYHCDLGLEPKYPNKFIAHVGRFTTFPYFRALVGHYSMASGANLPILPVLKQPIRAAAKS